MTAKLESVFATDIPCILSQTHILSPLRSLMIYINKSVSVEKLLLIIYEDDQSCYFEMNWTMNKLTTNS